MKQTRYNEEKQRIEVLESTRWREGAKEICLNCGREFWAPVAAINRGQRFCSRECGASRNMRIRWLKKGRGTLPKWCEVCGERFLIKASQHHRRRTCGKPECTSVLRSKLSLEYQRKRREASREKAL